MKFGTFIRYKGYQGSIEYSAKDKVYYGKLLDIKDLVNYEGNSIENLYNNYKHAIDDYITFCNEMNTDTK